VYAFARSSASLPFVHFFTPEGTKMKIATVAILFATFAVAFAVNAEFPGYGTRRRTLHALIFPTTSYFPFRFLSRPREGQAARWLHHGQRDF
jgi:hypothetical protein